MGVPDDETVAYRPGTSRPIAVATVLMCAVLAGGQLLGSPLDAASTYAVLAGLLFVATLAWVALWQPVVRVLPHGVELENPVRRVLVTWPALHEVDGRFGLRLRTAESHWSAWAAGPPSGRARTRGQASEAAALVRTHWDRVRDAGHLDSGAVEGPTAQVTWRTPQLVALAVPAVLLLGALLAVALG
ncbi:hypothetical protein KLP28_00240 [Nocardioidaceae bacterium]|nr:hypothetical protein KLP28_00240 [Nocardioidaceae bacterium]